MKLYQVVLQLDGPELEAWLQDDDGTVARPVRHWIVAKSGAGFPYKGWVSQLEAEVLHNRQQDARTRIP